jgi:hypothetical protein
MVPTRRIPGWRFRAPGKVFERSAELMPGSEACFESGRGRGDVAWGGEHALPGIAIMAVMANCPMILMCGLRLHHDR